MYSTTIISTPRKSPCVARTLSHIAPYTASGTHPAAIFAVLAAVHPNDCRCHIRLVVSTSSGTFRILGIYSREHLCPLL